MTELNFTEKRKYARVDLRSRINFTIAEMGEAGSPQEMFRAMGKNMGIEGLLFNSDKKLDPGTILEMDILLPYQSQPVKIQGEVRWSKPVKDIDSGRVTYDTGVRFPKIDENHVYLLVKHICGNLSKDMIRRLNDEAQLRK